MENIVLLVDDNKDLVDMLTVLFLQNGWVAQRAYSGTEALACIEHIMPTLIVCDLSMPRMSGFEVAETLINAYQGDCPPLIALTAWSDPELARQALSAGFSVVLTKPIDFEQLFTVVKTHIPRAPDAQQLATAGPR